MKRLVVVAVMMLIIGCAGYAAAEDLMEKDLRILADQYTAASSNGDTELFTKSFRSYMIGSNRLNKAAEQQRKIYEFSFDTTIDKFEIMADKKSCVVANADYEAKRHGQTLAKGKITATYSVKDDRLVLVMVRFADEVVKYKDADKLINEKSQDKQNNVMFVPDPNSQPDFSNAKKLEQEI
ncbi:MAG TPA: hypothetical protein VMT71_11480 [Syntrophorhabdales bacterium]|nr:hypothetical protein [Syntrophorhabdales bacterium]